MFVSEDEQFVCPHALWTKSFTHKGGTTFYVFGDIPDDRSKHIYCSGSLF